MQKSTAGSPPHTVFEKLEALRAAGGSVRTGGLPDEVVKTFLDRDPTLGEAIERAFEAGQAVRAEFPDLMDLDEVEQTRAVQSNIVNFYPSGALAPYMALGASGPWIVTSKGAVIHDSGGYGMLGQGHTPPAIIDVLGTPCPMANVMTPSVSQMRLVRALRKEIGHRREEGCPFSDFLFMNSGSESVTVASRICDVNAKLMTDPGGRYAGKPVRRLALQGGFHGRTQRPASFSDSTRKAYVANLASFRDAEPLHTVVPNDLDGLRAAFAQAGADGVFIEAFFTEPVMGEGNPGMAITREFYDLARTLTAEHGALLLVDSIQAGLRAHGCLSLVDYPGFEDCVPPDLETYSKALNAGQYPLSVLAMTPAAAALYRPGIYGNTMTAAARAMEVGAAVLASVTPELRANIQERGREFVTRLEALAAELDGAIPKVQGTGLLVCCALDPKRYLSYGENSTEEYLRERGFGVIHGGQNALRYTPHFAVTSEELALIVDSIRDAVLHGPQIG